MGKAAMGLIEQSLAYVALLKERGIKRYQ